MTANSSMSSIAEYVERNSPYSQKAAKDILKLVVQFITDCLSVGESVTIPLLGNFQPEDKVVGGNNPQTGEPLPEKEKRFARFNPSTFLVSKIQPDFEGLISDSETNGELESKKSADANTQTQVIQPPPIPVVAAVQPDRIWYMAVSGQSSQQVIESQLIATGLKPETLVWNPQITQTWTEAENVPELKYLFQ
ncbi:MAG TPA: HU family DNA-binding protein [Nostocaceae cyanobacterium]|nr:HU family DNA-binding protein [Nostocaceae cyanobacterium]